MQQISLESATGQGPLNVRVWEPENQPKAVLQIVHGMAEHIDRYDGFARYLNQNSILVIGADHASHGKSISKNGIRGYFGAEKGWDSLISDINSVHQTIKQSYCALPNNSLCPCRIRAPCGHWRCCQALQYGDPG